MSLTLTIKRSFFGWTEKDFLKTLWILALPISLQHLLTSSLSFIDVLMIGQLGDAAIGSVGLINKLFFVGIMILSAIASGASILSAQFFGKKDWSGISQTFKIALLISLTFIIPIALAAFFAPQTLLSFVSQDTSVIEIGAEYLKITSLFLVFTAISMVTSAILRTINQAKIPMIAGIIAVVLNTFLNYLLIFGHAGFPELGVKGAAYATVISRSVEMLLLLTALIKLPETQKLREVFLSKKLRLTGFTRFWHTSYPLILNELFWSLGLFAYQVVYSRMGKEELAAMSLLVPIDALVSDFFIGVAIASGIILGQTLGAGDKEKAYDMGFKFISLAAFIGAVMGIILLVIQSPVLSVFSGLSETTLQLATSVYSVMALTLWIKFFNMTAIMGVLRSGGDTRFVLVYDIGTIWLIGVPTAILLGLFLQWPLQWVFMAVMFEELLKMAIWLRRIRSKRWLNQLTA
ncbi:MAG: MATE family efflux transporter [Pseudomonadota bacterium]